MFVHGKYFYGNEISEYGQKNGYVDYATLAKAFDAVLNNNIIQNTYEIGWWEQESGMVDNSEEIEELREKIEELEEQLERFEQENQELLYDSVKNEIEELEEQIEELEEEQDCMDDIFQYYIVDDNGARILKEINEIVFYNDALDMYVWGVTHCGTSWSYVLTDIKCNVPYDFDEE